MIHIGKTPVDHHLKGISAGHSQNSYRGLVKIMPTATNARNFTQCDSMLIGADCGAHTFPYVECRNNSAQLEHEATTSRIREDQLFYRLQRRISEEDAISMIVNGLVRTCSLNCRWNLPLKPRNSSPLVLNTASVKESTC